MRWRSNWRRTPVIWLAAAACVLALNLVAVGSTPAILGTPGPDYTLRDTYYLVDPFGFTLGFVPVFAGFAAFYFWCEQGWGGAYSPMIGKIHLGLGLLGFILIVLPAVLANFGGQATPGASDAQFVVWQGRMTLAGALSFLSGLIAFIAVCLRGLWIALALSGGPL